jgi:hypothetical protein
VVWRCEGGEAWLGVVAPEECEWRHCRCGVKIRKRLRTWIIADSQSESDNPVDVDGHCQVDSEGGKGVLRKSNRV